MGTIQGIATRVKTKAPMDTHSKAKITFEGGVGNDSRGRKQNKRQVTVLSNDSWSTVCTEMNVEMPWTTRRANLLIEGIELEHTKGKFLHIGNCILEITGELVPCNRMDEQFDGLTYALSTHWRGGVTCKIIAEGHVNVGDEIVLND